MEDAGLALVPIRQPVATCSGGEMRIQSVLRTVAAVGLVFGLTAPAFAQDAKKAAPSAASPVGQGWTGQVQPGAGTDGKVLDQKQIAAIKKVADYFNSLANLKSVFQQTNPDGKRLRGKLAVKKPGRFRFDYNLPSKQVVISDGKMLAIQDTDVNSDDRYELDNTPFRMLLKKDVDLLRDARILDIQEADDLIILTVMDKSPDAPGKIKLFFSVKPSLELKEWVTTDAQNLDTRVELSGVNRTEEVDAAVFDIKSVAIEHLQKQR
jgi:outer membrane lipoprotein-sorting protein